VSVRELTVRFGDQVALDAIDLTVPRGTVIGLIGPSGCGKTTLVRTMLGISAPSAGEVRVFGRDPARMSTRDRARVAYMPQLPVLFPNLTVLGNLQFVASLYGVPLRHRRARLRAVLDLVDLGEHASKRLAECSGGMQRRLTLAATLVHDPELIFLDEPTAGVDPILRERFWSHFRELRNRGKTIVVPTQYVGEAVSCDLVAVMSSGRLVTVDTPSELAERAFRGDPLRLELASGWVSGPEIQRITQLPFVTAVRRMDDDLLVVVDDAARDRQRLIDALHATGLPPVAVTPVEPTFDQIFVELIEAHRAATNAADNTAATANGSNRGTG
jgi:ABC-2 type transport system ATP-binding protein